MSEVHLIQYRPSYSVQAYLRFANIHFSVENSDYPCNLSTGQFPQLHHSSTTSSKLRIVAARDIIDHLRKHVADLDEGLTPPQQNLSRLLEILVIEKLGVSLLYSRWVGWTGGWEDRSSNFKSALSEEMAHMYGIRWTPFSSLIHGLQRVCPEAFVPSVFFSSRKSFAILAAQGFYDRSMATIGKVTEDHYSILESALCQSSSTFFHSSSSPTTIDAVVFGHVAEAMYEKVSRFGRTFEEKFPTLWRHYQRIYSTYFAQNSVLHPHIQINNNNTFSLEGVERAKREREEEGRRFVRSEFNSASQQEDLCMGSYGNTKGSFKQEKLYEKRGVNVFPKGDQCDPNSPTPNKRTPTETKRILYNKYFIAGIGIVMLAYGVFSFQRSKLLEALLEDDE